MESVAAPVCKETDLPVRPGSGAEIAASHRTHQALARSVPASPVRAHSPQPVQRIPLKSALFRHGDLVYLPSAAQPRNDRPRNPRTLHRPLRFVLRMPQADSTGKLSRDGFRRSGTGTARRAAPAFHEQPEHVAPELEQAADQGTARGTRSDSGVGHGEYPHSSKLRFHDVATASRRAGGTTLYSFFL